MPRHHDWSARDPGPARPAGRDPSRADLALAPPSPERSRARLVATPPPGRRPIESLADRRRLGPGPLARRDRAFGPLNPAIRA